jgi:flagellar basal-body rod protein FlgC
MVSFENVLEGGRATGEVRTSKVMLDQTDLAQIYDPSHPLADESGRYDGSNVDLVVEIADAREAQRSYEANLRMFDQAKQMQAALIELLRR